MVGVFAGLQAVQEMAVLGSGHVILPTIAAVAPKSGHVKLAGWRAEVLFEAARKIGGGSEAAGECDVGE